MLGGGDLLAPGFIWGFKFLGLGTPPARAQRSPAFKVMIRPDSARAVQILELNASSICSTRGAVAVTVNPPLIPGLLTQCGVVAGPGEKCQVRASR